MSRLPAPGSAVPGAPPALQRPLTEADGEVVPSPEATVDGAQFVTVSPSANTTVGAGSWPLLAVAAAALGAGIEAARLLARRQ